MIFNKFTSKNIKTNISVIIVLIGLSLIIGFGVKSISSDLSGNIMTDFGSLNARDKLQTVLALRDQGIKDARENGDYRCCIEPARTMCYTGANKWNYFTAGTCACDDFIAKGEEACPQCQRGLDDIHDEDNIYCDIDSSVSNCQSLID
jgi:hypothetical protein